MRTLFRAATVVLLAGAMFPSNATAAGGGGRQLGSARDLAAAVQAESMGGPFNSVCTSGVTFGFECDGEL